MLHLLNELGGWGPTQLDSTGTGALCSDHSVAETGSVEASLFDGLLMEKRSRCRKCRNKVVASVWVATFSKETQQTVDCCGRRVFDLLRGC